MVQDDHKYVRRELDTRGSWRRSPRRGKRQDKGRALPLHAVHGDPAPMGDDNLLHNIEAQAGATRLSGIEWPENAWDLRGRHADPAIADVQLDLRGGADAREAQRTPVGHGLDGILYDIEHGAP